MGNERILIVEDDAILAAHLEEMLSGLGYEVVGLAASGATAIALALAQQPNAILMDIHLRGEMNGIQASEEIHKTADIPVVFLTAYSDDTLLQQAKSGAAYAYLTKPVRDHDLSASLGMVLSKHASELQIKHLNQLLHTIRDVNKLIAREHDPQKLLQEACKIIAQTRGYKFVWIGELENDLLKPVASAGTGLEFINHIFASASREQGQKLPGTNCAKTKKVVTCHDILHDERYAPWAKEADEAQLCSTTAVPLLCKGRLFGVMSVYSDQAGLFAAEEVQLLFELAADLAFGLKTLEEESGRRQAEAALQISEAKYRSLVESSGAAIGMLDMDGRLRFINEIGAGWLGGQAEDFIGKTCVEVYPEPYGEQLLAGARRVIKNSQGLVSETQMPIRGQTSWVNISIQPIRDSAGKAFMAMANITDISERKQAAEALRKNEARFRALIEKAADLIVVIDATGNIQFASPSAENILGYKPEEAIGRSFLEWLHPDDLPQAGTSLASRSRIPGTAPESIFVRCRHKNGEWREIEALGTNLLAEPAVNGIVLNIRDVTERKLADEALQKSEQDYRQLIQHLRVGVLVHAPDSGVLMSNPQAGILLGLTMEQMLGKSSLDTVWNFIREDQTKMPVEEYPVQQVAASMLPIENLVLGVIRPARQDVVWVLVNAFPEIDANHKLQKIVVIFVDITERKQADEARNENEKRYRNLFEESPISLWEEDFSKVKQRLDALKEQGVKDFSGYLDEHPEVVSECVKLVEVTDVNKATLKLFHANQKEELVRNLAQITDNDTFDLFNVELVNILEGKTVFDREFSSQRLDGEKIEISMRWSAVPGSEKPLSKVVISMMDITERKQAEKNLRKRSREINLLYETSQELSHLLDIDSLYNALYNQIARIMPCDGLFISSYNEQAGLIRCEYANTENNRLDVSEFPLIPLEPEGQGIQSQVIRTGKPWLLNDFQAQFKKDNTRHYVSPEGQITAVEAVPEDADVTRSGIILPLLIKENVLGAIQILSYKLNAYSQEDFKIAEALAAQFAIANTNARLYRNAQIEISERKRIENDLRQSQAELAKAQAMAHVGNYALDTVNNRMTWSDELKRIIGCEDQEPSLELMLSLIHPQDRVLASKAMYKVMKNENVVYEYRIIRPDGAVRWVRDQVETLDSGQPRNDFAVHIFGALQDITERKLADDALRASEEKFRSVIEQSVDGITMIDDTGTVIEWNRGQEQITGLARQIVVGRKLWDVQFMLALPEKKSPQIYEALRASIIQALATGESPFLNRAYENVIVHPGGTTSVMQSLAFITATGNTKILGSVSRDVTEKKQIEDLLRRQLSELEVLYENSLSISRLLEPRQIGQKLIEVLSTKLDWHHAVIRLYKQERQKLEVVAFSNPHLSKVEMEKQVIRLNQLISEPGQGLSGWVVEHGQPVRCAKVRDDPRYIETYAMIRSGLYVPIRTGEQTLGSISVESELENAFSEQDERLLVTIASQAAISIENARLFSLAQQELAERKRVEEQLRKAQTELEKRVEERTAEVSDLYDNAPCGYHSLDADGNFAHINKTELTWLGFERDEMIGRPMLDFLSARSQARFAQEFRVFKKNGTIQDKEMEFIRKDGSIVPLLINATAIFDENGAYKMSRTTLVDVSQRKLAEQALRKSEAQLRQNRDELSAANIALEKAARLKDEFLASMSHELRTPLTGILGLSEAMQLKTYGELSEKQLKTLKNIENSGRHLLDLINDILDLSKIEAGKLDMEFEQCSLNDICQASLQLTKGLAQQKHQMIDFSMQPAMLVLRADKRRLKQMLVNLLANAVKFTPDGGALGIEVRGKVEEQKLDITVWDNGIGIKNDDLPRLFQPFVQLDSSLSRQYAGTGLGLSLVKRMAELHNGKVDVESVLGRGSRFTISLPWSGNPTRPFAALGKNKAGLQRAMSIDHNAIETEQLTRYLHNLGIANNIQKTTPGIVEKAAQDHPEIILMELSLPEKSGFDVLAELRADERTRSIPVVLMSVEEKRKKAISLGAAGYLVKPFSQADLNAELERVFNVPIIPEETPLPESALVLVADDNEENLQMIADFLKSRKFVVDKARNGIEMLEHAAKFRPNIILVDIQMPEMDGLEAIQRIRAHADTGIAATPMIAITALAMPGDRERCLAAGANDYMSKPLPLGQLVETIFELLKLNKA